MYRMISKEEFWFSLIFSCLQILFPLFLTLCLFQYHLNFQGKLLDTFPKYWNRIWQNIPQKLPHSLFLFAKGNSKSKKGDEMLTVELNQMVVKLRVWILQ